MSKNLEEMGFKNFEELNKNVFADVRCDESGKIVKVLSTYRNFRIMCQYYKIEISYPNIWKKIVSRLDAKSRNSIITMIECLMIVNGMDHHMAAKYIDLLAEENPTKGEQK